MRDRIPERVFYNQEVLVSLLNGASVSTCHCEFCTISLSPSSVNEQSIVTDSPMYNVLDNAREVRLGMVSRRTALLERVYGLIPDLSLGFFVHASQ